MINRTIQTELESWIGKNKVIILYGPRQTGKTTMVENILNKTTEKTKYIDCDLLENRNILKSQNKEILQQFLGDYDLVVIDEAQRVENIGLNLKIIHKYLPKTQIIATGSSSFELANKINEPLTGRNVEFLLFPFSLAELKQEYDILNIQSQLENILRFGLYPDIFQKPENQVKKLLNTITDNYLYRDILEYSEVRKSDTVEKLLQILAFCIGGELSYSELGAKVGVNRLTVEKYLDLLEKCFVIKIIRPFKRNLIKEITKPFKVYFWDIGIRNSIIQAYNTLEFRSDIGQLWENFCVMERVKLNNNLGKNAQYYFWRTTDQKEIDLVEVIESSMHTFEIKWSQTKQAKIPEIFQTSYPRATFDVINSNNWWKYLI